VVVWLWRKLKEPDWGQEECIDRMKTVIIVFCALFFLLPTSTPAEDMTIYDSEWNVKGHVHNNTVYDRDWKIKGYIRGDKLYDKDWNLEEQIGRDGKVYDKNWEPKGRVKDGRIYDNNWKLKGTIKKGGK
jgi:hypothetical protein